jgi:hypothetical protein
VYVILSHRSYTTDRRERAPRRRFSKPSRRIIFSFFTQESWLAQEPVDPVSVVRGRAPFPRARSEDGFRARRVERSIGAPIPAELVTFGPTFVRSRRTTDARGFLGKPGFFLNAPVRTRAETRTGMDPDAPSPASVLLRELKEHAAAGALEPTAGALAGVTGAAPDGSDLAGHERRTTLGDGPGPPTHAVSLSENCAESAGASRGDHEVGAWTSMLGVDDDEDVVALLARALDETPTSGFDPRPKHDRLFEQNRRRAVSGFERARRAHPYHGGVTRGVVSQLRRAHTVGAYPQTHEALTYDAWVRSVAGEVDPSRCADARRESLATPEGDFRDDSLVDRLRVSVGASVGAVRRAVSSPACHDGVPTTDTHPNAATGASVGGVDAYPLAAAAAAAEQSDASGSRPFGFLGVTRPPWHTRWEAHLEVSADAEPGADASESIRANPRTASLAESTRVFLGAFDAKESAARAHDAAKLKLFGPPPACGALNFPAEEYLDALGEMRACDFPEFVRSLVRHAHAGERRLSRFRGVHATPDGKWEARLERDDDAV